MHEPISIYRDVMPYTVPPPIHIQSAQKFPECSDDVQRTVALARVPDAQKRPERTSKCESTRTHTESNGNDGGES